MMRRNALCAAVLFASFASGVAQSAEVNWSDYVRSATSLAFVTSGLSIVDGCAVPLVFTEQSKDGVRVLEILCREENNAAMARILFYEQGDDPVWLMPWEIQLIP
jgi:hypothetical protein